MTEPLTLPNVTLKVLEYLEGVHFVHTTVRQDLNEIMSLVIFYCCIYLH